LATVLLLAAVRLDPHPHYQFACAWAPLFGMAAGLPWLRRRRRGLGILALVGVAALAVAQFSMIVEWMGYIRERGGTRGGPYATPVGLEIEAMRTVCAGPEPVIVLRNDTEMHPYPFEYLAVTEAACRGKTVIVCASALQPHKPCPPTAPNDRLRRLSYASAKGGALRVE